MKRGIVDHTLHAVVACVFLVSGFSKGAHLDGFVGHLNRFNIMPANVTPWLAVGLCLLELGLGSLLLSGYKRTWVRRFAAILLLIFATVLMIGIFRGWPQECGCYGQLFRMKPTTTIGQDCFLVLVLTFLQWRNLKDFPHAVSLAIVVFVFSAGLTVFAARTSHFDAFLVRLRPGFQLEVMPCIGAKSSNGFTNRLAVITDVQPEASQLKSLAEAFPGHELILIDASADRHVKHPAYTVMPGKTQILFYYYHHAPTVFTVENGVVRRVWYGRLPETATGDP